MPWLARFACIIALTSATWGTAQAQPVRGARTSYQMLMRLALGEFGRRNWLESHTLLRRAHELEPSARTFHKLGMVSFEMGEYVRAFRELNSALSDPREPLTDQQRDEAHALAARCQDLLGLFKLTLPPDDAQASVDGRPATPEERTPLLRSVGSHALTTRREGYATDQGVVSVSGREDQDLTIALASAPAVVASPPVAPLSQSTPASAQEPQRVTHASGLSWLVLGSAAAAGAASAGMWLAGAAKARDLEAQCRAAFAGECRPGTVDMASLRRFERTTTALLGVTGLLSVTWAMLFYFERSRGRLQELQLSGSLRSVSLRARF